MPMMEIILHGDAAFGDVEAGKVSPTNEKIRVAVLEGGMESGDPSVAIGLFLPNNGGVILGQTSLALFLTAADAFKARFGDPRR